MAQHLIVINYAYQNDLETPLELLKSYFNLSGWAQACVRSGVKVTVFQRFKSNHRLTVNGVNYVFISDDLPALPACHQQATAFNEQVKVHVDGLNDIAFHINGLIFPRSVMHLTKLVGNLPRFIIQHHAEQPTGRLLQWLNCWANRRIDRFFFTTKDHAQPWIKAKTLKAEKVVELMECSSNCRPHHKTGARKKLGIKAQPLLLWTANLDENKDPLTILAGFELFLKDYPNAKLVMLYRHAPLLDAVKSTISQSKKLTEAVSLVGEISYDKIGDYYNAADIFVQGSAIEGSGVAVLDALACGAVPVVTDIPSFATITENGLVGQLWQRGQAEQFAQALHTVMIEDFVKQQHNCLSLFIRRWTFKVLADEAMVHYFE